MQWLKRTSVDKEVICFDFDGVIATYDGYKGVDIFGEPIKATIDCMSRLKKDSYVIIIWTTRKETPKLLKYLKDNNVVYDSINDYSHNPSNTSIKPLYACLIDDRALGFKPEMLESSDILYNKIIEMLEK